MSADDIPMTHTASVRRIERLAAAALQLGRFAELKAWCRELRNLWAAASSEHAIPRRRARLADTSDDAMLEMLARTIVVQRGSRWERAAMRATIGSHATRLRAAGATGEQGLTRFKLLLERALPPASVRRAEQSRVAKEMVRWWVEAYYEVDA